MDDPRSSSRSRVPSRPTTPLRPSSRSSVREAHGYGASISNTGYSQPAINALEPQFAELADSVADLEANFMHLQLMHESLSRFSESFASFLYGLNMNAFCIDYPEVCIYIYIYIRKRRVGEYAKIEIKAPIPESFRHQEQARKGEIMIFKGHWSKPSTNETRADEVEQDSRSQSGINNETVYMCVLSCPLRLFLRY